ncbi:heme peroxidase [Scheffersomyces spartinae]|uniref:Peroxidase n=1 Tax=Scheffersomyces spartinae TaxID=45513 RepID=A0A9P7VA85_9ASCO|nr:heme peroxidase [Scheffersomyces spartinae]KAG7193896.1 heme peroxidase [Scheffersomyces spartinae]
MSAATLRQNTFSVAKMASKTSGNSARWALGGASVAAIGAYLYYNNNNNNKNNNSKNIMKAGLFGGATLNAAAASSKTFNDYQAIYNDIAEKVRENDEYDGGAGYFGILTRLAWHSSGTYDASKGSGGSFGGNMVFAPEQYDGANAGLAPARDFLSEFQYKYPWISRGDLWTLGGVVAVQEAGGPKIPWRPGRVNATDGKKGAPNTLPDASRDGKYVKGLFGRMGFNEQETVALIGAHCLGKCHKNASGYEGPWGPSFNMFTNDFFNYLLKDWQVKQWDGPKQYEDVETKLFMMLPTDIALKEENYFLKWVKIYADDEKKFFSDFSKAFAKLLELGIQFPSSVKPFEFKTLDEQE